MKIVLLVNVLVATISSAAIADEKDCIIIFDDLTIAQCTVGISNEKAVVIHAKKPPVRPKFVSVVDQNAIGSIKIQGSQAISVREPD